MIRWGVAKALVRLLSRYSEVLPDYVLEYLRVAVRHRDPLCFLDTLVNCLVVLETYGVEDPEVRTLVASLFDPGNDYPWGCGGG